MLRSARPTVMLALLCLAGAATAQEAPTLDSYVGHWRYDGTAQQGQAIIEAAVRRTVSGMGFIVSDVAAGRLRGKNQLVRNIAIARDGGRIRIDFDHSRIYETAPDQWTPHHMRDAETLSVLQRFHAGALVQLFRTDAGTRRDVFRLAPDGRMRLEVTVQSPQLPRDMHYTLVYQQP